MGSKTSSRCQVKGHACWGPSVLFAALSREWIQSHSKAGAQFLVGWTLRVRGKLFEPRCMRRNVKNCVIATLPGWGYSASHVILNTLGRRALSFPWASLTPQQSQFTLLDFQSMESLMLGEIGFLARDKLPGRQRALAMAVFSPSFKTTAVSTSPTSNEQESRGKDPTLPANIWSGMSNFSCTGRV